MNHTGYPETILPDLRDARIAELERELAALRTQSERTAIKYVRCPVHDRRIERGDDFAGDAWVRWTAVGHTPEDAA